MQLVSGEYNMADRTLVRMGLKFEDVGGERRIDELDRSSLAADLLDAGVPSRQRSWLSLQPLGKFDRVLLARGEHDGKYEGALLLQCRIAGETPFLVIEALSGESDPRGDALLKRILAYLILRFDTFHDRPVAILARTLNPTLTRVMRDVASEFGGAGFYPEPGGSIVSLAAASFAHRLARAAALDRRFAEARRVLEGAATDAPPDGPMMATIDLRAVEEMALSEAARRQFRKRLSRLERKARIIKVVAMPGTNVEDRPRLPAHVAARAPRATPVGPTSRR
jgi:hypothetical protein